VFRSDQNGQRSALTKYFGKVAGREGYKYRGIESRQRSTPEYVANVQRDLIDTLHEHREPEPVANRLARYLNDLRSGSVDPDKLTIQTRVSKPLEAYQQRNRTVAALQRYQDHGMERSPGQDIHYVVVDDDKRSRERVRLSFEADDYDRAFYAELLFRAAESVLSSLEWDRDRIKRYLRDTQNARLTSYS